MDLVPFISIVVPVYNAQNYIKDTIEGVLAQTFTDYELILVDDCSSDMSREICEDYAKRYDNIRIIAKDKNSGAAQARNFGMAAATGEYVYFLDADDVIDNDLLALAADKARAGYDVVMFGLVEEYCGEDDKVESVRAICPDEKTYEDVRLLRESIIEYENSTLLGYVWNKLYRKAMLDETGVSFEHCALNEDYFFNMAFFAKARSMSVINAAPYHYRIRRGQNLTNRFVAEYYSIHRRRVGVMYKQYLEWEQCTRNVAERLSIIYTRYIFSALQQNCNRESGMHFFARRRWLKELYKDKLFNRLIPYASPDSRLLKVMSSLLKRKNVLFTLFLARVIYVVKNKMPFFFAKIKNG